MKHSTCGNSAWASWSAAVTNRTQSPQSSSHRHEAGLDAQGSKLWAWAERKVLSGGPALGRAAAPHVSLHVRPTDPERQILPSKEKQCQYWLTPG